MQHNLHELNNTNIMPNNLDTGSLNTSYSKKLYIESTIDGMYSIPSNKRIIGMLISVQENGLLYKWDGTNFNELSKEDVALSNVDNTADINKPISTATQTALDSKLDNGFTISQLRLLSDSEVTTTQLFYCSEAGKEGFWKYNPSNTTGTDNLGTLLVTTTGGKRLERVLESSKDTSKVYATWFGAVSDWNESTKTATDCTTYIQNAINYLLSNRGGEIWINGQFLVNGTIYVNSPVTQIPISIKGFIPASAIDGNKNGNSIYRQVAGDVFRVNLDAVGKGFLGGNALYNRFALDGVQFARRRTTDNIFNTGMTAIKTFRVQSAIIKNTGVWGFDYLISQPDSDENNVESYNDQWIIENIRCQYSTLGFLKLFTTDATSISNISFHDPLPTCMKGIEIKYGTTTKISNLVQWNPSDGDITNIGSAFIELIGCRAMDLNNFHIERPVFESVIKITSCLGMSIKNIHSRFRSNDFFVIKNSEALTIDYWDSWEDKPSGKFDIKLLDGNNNNINLLNNTFSNFTGSTKRNPILSSKINIENANIIYLSDSDYTLSTNQENSKFILPIITSNRTLNLPDSANPNNRITLFVRNTSFNWFLNKSIVLNSTTEINSLKPQSVYNIIGDNEGNYRVESWFSDEAKLSESQTFTGNNIFNKNIGIGSIDNSTSLNVDKNITGGSESNGVWSRGEIQSGVTTAFLFRTTGRIASGVSLTELVHYRASALILNGTSTSQTGFQVESNLTGATNNFGYKGLIDAGSNRWNLYMAGTANNYIAGKLLLGSNIDNGVDKLQVTGTVKIQHLKGGTSTPIISVGAGAGTSATVSISGSDLCGTITITTGTSPLANAVLATINFNVAYGTAPIVIIKEANANAVGVNTVYVPANGQTNGTTTIAFNLTTGAIALAASTTYMYYYQVMQ